MFRIRHADGQWVWVRARAEVVDPDAPEIHLIGIAIDVTEQYHLTQRSEAADLRLRTAIENITESFVLWDAKNRLVMCNSKYQQEVGLAGRDIAPGTLREDIERQMKSFVSERRLANAGGARGAATYERLLADGIDQRRGARRQLRVRHDGMHEVDAGRVVGGQLGGGVNHVADGARCYAFP